MFNFKDILTISLTLFAVIDIVGSVPIVVSLREKFGHIESEKATFVSGALMLLFLYFGESLLNIIGIDVSSFALAGSIVIFILGLELVLGINLFKTDPDAESGSIVPIAFPIIAGAGTLTTIMSLSAVYSHANILIGILVNLIVVYLVLKSTKWIAKKLGKGGLAVIRKFFGIILLSIAIKIFKGNI
jgi:multiple antibiotic resistance protein